MSKALRTIGMVVGAVALVATGVGVVAGPAFAASAAGATVASIASYAKVLATAASIGAQLTYKPPTPTARGSVSQIVISPDAPQPYVMGEGYYAGVLRHDCAYGATLKKVPNPFRFMAIAYSGGGPVQSLTPYVDQAPVSSWYGGFLQTDVRFGTCPDTALSPGFGAAPGWTTDSKMSGTAAIGWGLKFDKEGERFASGIPQLGAYGQWVKVYDPRKDSTRPGGLGTHVLGDETTYEWSENPALHAGTYAYGRYQNGRRTIGCGMEADAIDWAEIAAWANVCDANAWSIFGVVYEPGSRWQNLRDIAAAGGAIPYVRNGILSFSYAAPRVVLDTFTEDDLAPEADGSVTAMRSRFGRINTIIPKYRSPDHNWELVSAVDTVTSPTYVTEDGEERRLEWVFNFVKDKDQAAQLAGYALADARELQPITITFGYRVRDYGPGDCVHLLIPALGLDHDVLILEREYDHAAMTTRFTMIGETSAKHAWALGQTVTAPPTGSITYQTPEERDELRWAAMRDIAAAEGLNLDGTVMPGMVNTDAIVTDAVTQTTFDEWSESRSLPHSLGDYRYINTGGLIFPSGGRVQVRAEMLTWLTYSVSGLSGGEQIGAEFAITRWEGGAPGETEDLADYVAAGATVIVQDLLLLKTNYDGTVTSGTVTTEKRSLSIDYIDPTPGTDGAWYAVWAKMDTSTGGGSVHSSDYQRMTLMEIKR